LNILRSTFSLSDENIRLLRGYSVPLEPMTRKLMLVFVATCSLVAPELSAGTALRLTGLAWCCGSNQIRCSVSTIGSETTMGGWAEGGTVPSNGPSNRLWIQDGAEIECWNWPAGDSGSGHESGLTVSLLRRSASRELELLPEEEITAAIHKYWRTSQLS